MFKNIMSLIRKILFKLEESWSCIDTWLKQNEYQYIEAYILGEEKMYPVIRCVSSVGNNCKGKMSLKEEIIMRVR